MATKNITKICAIDGCDQLSAHLEMCQRHYTQDYLARMPECSFDGCSNHVRGPKQEWCEAHKLRLKVHGDVSVSLYNHGVGTTREEKFWSKVVKHQSGCWEWQGCTNGSGYGVVGNPVNSLRLAHRYAYFLVKGFLPATFLLHSCDNPICVNPEHLKEGTQADNIADMMAKNRNHKGSRTGGHKLTEDQVLSIREQLNNGAVGQDLARQYGVYGGCISAIRHRRTWKHI